MLRKQLSKQILFMCLAVLGIVITSGAESKPCAVSRTVRDEPPKDQNADRFGFGDWNINPDRTIWVQSNTWHAGSEGNKVIWIRPAGTTLVVTGKLVRAESPTLQASEDRGYPTGFTVINLQFPTGGCWEVEAKAGKYKLSFVARVANTQAR